MAYRGEEINQACSDCGKKFLRGTLIPVGARDHLCKECFDLRRGEEPPEDVPVIECNACGYPVYSTGCPSCMPEYYERG